MNCYQGKLVWIIGASQGIGRALAKKLASLGCDLVLSSRSSTDLEVVNQSLYKEAIILPLDVSNYNDFNLTAQQALVSYNFDYIFYFPGYYEPGYLPDMAPDVIQSTIDINFRSVVYLLKFALPYLKSHRKCQLLVAASIAGYIGLPNSQPYAATKAAVINLIESAKAENLHLNIRLINPGFVKTRLTDKNNFRMPAIISTDVAADIIVKNLLKPNFEIHFPKLFSFFFKILKNLPYRLYFYLVNRFFLH